MHWVAWLILLVVCVGWALVLANGEGPRFEDDHQDWP